MPLSQENRDEIDKMIVVSYLFVYETEWQNVPRYVQKHLLKNIPNSEPPVDVVFTTETIKERWVTLQKEKGDIYNHWVNKDAKDEEVRDFCFQHGMWV